MAKQAPQKAVCAEIVELAGKKANGMLEVVRFSCDNEMPGHKEHIQRGVYKGIRYTLIWFASQQRPPPSARN